MRDIKIVMPDRRCFVRIKSDRKADRETVYIEAGPSWRRRSRTNFRFLVHAFSHESVHLVIEGLAPRLRITSGQSKGIYASEALDNLADYLTSGVNW